MLLQKLLKQPLLLVVIGLISALTPCPPVFSQAGNLALQPPADPFELAPSVLQARKLRGLRAEIVSLVLLAEPGGEIALEGLAIPVQRGEPKADVRIFLEIDGASLLEHNQEDPARIEVYAYALDSANQVADYLAEAFALAVKEHGEAIWQGGLKFYGALRLAPGEYRLRLLVRNYQSKSAGLRELRLLVPQPTTDPAIIPFFDAPRARDAWLPVRPWSDPTGATPPYPFAVPDAALRPAAQPVMVADRRAEIWVYARGLPAGALAGTVSWKKESKTAASAKIEVLERHPAPGAASAELIKIALMPPALSPGTYPIELRLEGGGKPAVVAADLPVFLLDPSTRERELLWTDLRWLLSGTKTSAAATSGGKTAAPGERKSRRRGQRQRVEQLAEQYRWVLRGFATSPSVAARTALLDFETQVLAGEERGGLAALLAAELTAAEGLAGGDVESLIPLITLHNELYQVYRQRRMFSLVFHARALIEQLADLYAQRGGSQGSRVVAARVLASLAGYLQDANLPAGSRRLFERSLEYDAKGRAALLGLAVSFEKYGDYGRARDLLETLAAAYPRFTEGLLHLANNLARTGDVARARELWGRVIELEGPVWVRTLAYQELARSWLGIGNLATAVELLERAIAEAPEETGTHLLLAYAYDRLQQPKRAFELVGQASAGEGETHRGESARKIYDSWPELALAEERRDLATAAEQRLPVLRRLLGTGAPETDASEGSEEKSK